MNIVYDRAMKVEASALYYDDDGNVDREEPLATFDLAKLDEIAEYEVVKKEGTTKPKVSLQFELSRSQLLKLVSAKVGVEETVLEEIIPETTEEDKKEEEDEKKDDADGENNTDGDKDTDSEDGEKSESADETDDAEVASTEDEKPKEYKETKVPHTYPLEPETTYIGARILSEASSKEIKKRLKTLEKRDENKKLTDEAKNSYEELIYEMRGWLNEEDNEVYVKSDDRESLLEKLEEAEDWLYGDGSDMGYKEYQSKQYDLNTQFTPLKKRQKEHQNRVEYIEPLLDLLREQKTKALEIRESMPWITEGEQDDLTEKIQELIDFIEEKMNEQNTQGSLDEEPLFTMEEIEGKMKKLETLTKKIYGKKKPKEPKKPKEKKPKDEDKKEDTDGEEKSDDQ
jgi:hypoxia up-regulated 1